MNDICCPIRVDNTNAETCSGTANAPTTVRAYATRANVVHNTDTGLEFEVFIVEFQVL